jgi:hypothetical protein
MRIFIFSILALFISSCHQIDADLIIHHAKIYTVDSNMDTASVMVIKDGKFIAVGGDTLLNQFQAKNTIDAKGQFIYPGFMDAHCHFTGYAMDKYKLILYGCTSFEACIEKIIAYAKTNRGTWIEGRMWDQNQWAQKEFPTKDTLDQLFPNTPVFLMRVDGHAVLCNQKALDLAKITIHSTCSGGEFQQKNGKLTGILIDNACKAVIDILPKRTQHDCINDFIAAQQDCVAYGLTSVIDCSVKNEIAQWLIAAQEKNKLQIRTSILLTDDKENFETFLHQSPLHTYQMHILGFKIFADGSLGSRGAYMMQDYNDAPNHHGHMLKSADSIKAIATAVSHSDYQLCIHAIGDGANHEVLRIFTDILPPNNNRRWRIEHAQVVAPSDFHYFGESKIIPSVQPTHAISDMTWAKDRIGAERLKTAYAYQQLLLQNNWLPLGTDFPVEGINPLHTFYAAVFRQDEHENPQNGFQTENALSRKEALQGITIWAAKSAFEEDQKGSIEKGKLADFVILPIDLMNANPNEIYNAKVTSTFIGGKKVFEKK